MEDELIGREPELDRIAGLVDGAADRGDALVVNGSAGIGKSVLLAAAAKRGDGLGHLVLSASGIESEVRLPFASLHQLLAPILHLLPSRPAPQRRALQAAFGEADGPAPEPFLIALGALNLLAEAASERPVLICVDDAHWLDEPSQETLAFISRRVSNERIAFLAAVRDGHACPLLHAGLAQIDLAGLDEPAARRLVARTGADLGPADREVVLRGAAGNPLALVELPAAWRRSGRGSRTSTSPAQPLTDRLEQAFAGRLADLPSDARDALLTAAIDHADALPEILAAATVLSGRPVGVDVLDRAVAAQLIAFDGLRLRFRHPLVRSAIVRSEPSHRVMAAHAALAEVLPDQPFRRVWHRAQSIVGFDNAIAEELAAGHTESLRRGSVLTAIRTLERAAELTTDSAARGRWLLLAAEHAFGLGDAALVADLLAAAGRTELTDLDRARISWLSEIFEDGVPGDADRVVELCGLAERSLADGDRDLALNLLLGASLRCWWADTGPGARARVAEVCAGIPGAAQDARAVAATATAEPVLRGTAVRGMLAAVRLTHDVDPDTLRLLGQAAHAVGDLPRAADLFTRCERLLREQGRLGLLSHVLTMQVLDRLLIGDWDLAARAIGEGRRIAAETGQPVWTSGSASLDAILQALRGHGAKALELAGQVEQHAIRRNLNDLLCCVQLARGIAELGEGRAANAYRELRRMFTPGDAAYHLRESFDGVMFLAEAAAAGGEVADAREILARLEDVAGVTDSPLLHVQLLFARAALADDRDAEVLYLTALGRDMTRWPFVRARVELGYGIWLRRHHRVAEARVRLRAALTALELIGAAPWAAQARAALGAAVEIAADADPGEALTEQELQIARLAAQGLSNREIGEQLFLSPRTIGSHLYRIFPKLGVTARGQIAARLAATPC